MGLPKDGKINLTRKYTCGPSNQITDVRGVSVGHVTIDNPEQDIHTGVTAILPHQGNLFQEKVMAGVSVINGFGKSAGLVQVEEASAEKPVCTVSAAEKDLLDMMAGRLSPARALLTRRVQAKGNPAPLMELLSLLNN